MLVGAAPALLNNNLASDSLAHCVEVSRTKILLYDTDEGCSNRIRSSKSRLLRNLDLQFIVLDENLKMHISKSDSKRPSKSLHAVLGDKAPLALLYTR